MTVHQSSSRRLHDRRFSICARAFWVVAVVVLLLAGCGDKNDDDFVLTDDFIDSCRFSGDIFEVSIRRSFDAPFDLLEVGVTPFDGPQPYELVISGTAFRDGLELTRRELGSVQNEFFDPLGELVRNALIVCDCFVDYVVVRSPSLDVIIDFNAQICS